MKRQRNSRQLDSSVSRSPIGQCSQTLPWPIGGLILKWIILSKGSTLLTSSIRSLLALLIYRFAEKSETGLHSVLFNVITPTTFLLMSGNEKILSSPLDHECVPALKPGNSVPNTPSQTCYLRPDPSGTSILLVVITNPLPHISRESHVDSLLPSRYHALKRLISMSKLLF